MRIEEVDALEVRAENIGGQGVDFANLYAVLNEALSALRAEAWHPIEKAEELGAKDGRWLLVFDGGQYYDVRWYFGNWMTADDNFMFPTHFRFINPPGN